jgi:hypothetical protein
MSVANQTSAQQKFDASLSRILAELEHHGFPGSGLTWHNLSFIRYERPDGETFQWDYNADGLLVRFHTGSPAMTGILSMRLHVPGNPGLGYDLKGPMVGSTDYIRWLGVSTDAAGNMIGAKWYPTNEVAGVYTVANHLSPSSAPAVITASFAQCRLICGNQYALRVGVCHDIEEECKAEAGVKAAECLGTIGVGAAAAGAAVGGTVGAGLGAPAVGIGAVPGAAAGAAIGFVGGADAGARLCFLIYLMRMSNCELALNNCIQQAAAVAESCLRECDATIRP